MKKLSRNNLISILVLIIIMSAIGIWSVKSYKEETDEGKKYSLILIPKAVDNTNGFWSSLMEGARLGAEEYNASIEVMGAETEEDIEGQISAVNEAIKKKPDAILIAASSVTEITPSLRKASKAGIKIILVDSLIEEDVGEATISTDNVKAGRELGEYTQKILDDNSQIAMVGHVEGTSTALDREKGMREGLGKYEKNIVEVVFAGSSYDRAFEKTEELLKKYPDLDAVMAMNEYSAIGAARAVDELGYTDKVSVFGFDNSLEEIQFLEKGVFDAIIIQKPVNMGYLGVEQAIKVLNGEERGKYIDSGCKLITRGNMYIDENQRLLYPFSSGQQ